MKKKIGFSIALIFASITISFAQNKDFTGHWTGKLMDQYNLTYDFVANGDALIGKDTHYDGTVDNISNGKIMGDSISYDVPISGNLTHITGKLKGDVLTIYFSAQGYDVSADLKKTDPAKK